MASLYILVGTICLHQRRHSTTNENRRPLNNNANPSKRTVSTTMTHNQISRDLSCLKQGQWKRQSTKHLHRKSLQLPHFQSFYSPHHHLACFQYPLSYRKGISNLQEAAGLLVSKLLIRPGERPGVIDASDTYDGHCPPTSNSHNAKGISL